VAKVFVGHDWAEAHHDVHIEDGEGRRLAEGVEGVARFHQLVAPLVEDPAEVVIATESDRACSWALWWPPATRCWRSIPCRHRATGNAIRPRERSPTPAMRWLSPSWPAPMPTTTGPSPATPTWPKR